MIRRLIWTLLAGIAFVTGASAQFWNNPSGPYEPNAVGFLTNNYLSTATLTVAGSPTSMLCSYWAMAPDPTIFVGGALFLRVETDGTHFMLSEVAGGNTDLGTTVWFQSDPLAQTVETDSNPGFIADGYWNNVLIYMSVAYPNGSKILQQYVNDVPQNQRVADGTDNTQTFAFFNGSTVSIGSTGLANFFMADVQCWLGVTTDLSVTANRRYFIDATGNPVPPSVAAAQFGTPVLLYTGNAAAFANNQGSGGGTTTVTGTLTDAGWTPAGIPGLGP